MTSAKTAVIEHIFFVTKGFRANGSVADPTVTYSEIRDAIDSTGAKLSKDNIANFWKDLTRGNNREATWPSAVLKAGYSGADAIGTQGSKGKLSFRFVPLPPGQVTAFEVAYAPTPEQVADAHVVQSLSMPTATKALGRRDENWLAQVATRLAVVETHFAIYSSRDVAEITFLQTGLKLRTGEVDTAYSLTDSSGGTWLLSGEAKGKNEPIHADQVLRAAQSLAATPAGQNVLGVIPFAMKIVGRSLIHTVEFEDLTAANFLIVKAEGVVQLQPHVNGIQ